MTEVRIEYSPEPAAEYLSDRTSFDAFISYERPDGAHGFIGIETKYTEPFSQRRDDKPSYRRWMSAKAPWREEAASSVADIAHNQLWRDHLLAVAMRDHYRSEYAEGHLMLVRHPGDASCARIVENYKTLLRDGDKTFIDMPLDELLSRWEGACEAGEADWLARFRDRYLPDSV